jgi:hypothetical protein
LCMVDLLKTSQHFAFSKMCLRTFCFIQLTGELVVFI